jgi:hypothetical protein
MLPALAPLFAKPLIKWGAIGIAVLALLAFTNWQTYDTMRTACEDEKNLAIQAASEAATKAATTQLMATIELNANVTAERDQKDQELQTLRENVRKKARKYANVKVSIPADLVRIHDEYARVSEQASRAGQLQPADPSPTRTEIQSGTVPAQAEQRVSVKLGDEYVEMTVEGTSLMLADTYDKFGLCLNDYSMFSAWNDGRERLELERLTKE